MLGCVNAGQVPVACRLQRRAGPPTQQPRPGTHASWTLLSCNGRPRLMKMHVEVMRKVKNSRAAVMLSRTYMGQGHEWLTAGPLACEFRCQGKPPAHPGVCEPVARERHKEP